MRPDALEPVLGTLECGGLVARVFGAGAVALTLDGVLLTTALRLDVLEEATGERWTFGPDNATGADRDTQAQHVPGLVGVRIARGSLDARLALGLPPGGAALVLRLDVANRSDAPRALTIASSVRLAAGAWETVASLDARTAEAAPGCCVAHTFVPDDGRAADSAAASEAEIRRTATLAPGETLGWTVCVGVGATAFAALGAVFPNLSGQRSRAALKAAQDAAVGPTGNDSFLQES